MAGSYYFATIDSTGTFEGAGTSPRVTSIDGADNKAIAAGRLMEEAALTLGIRGIAQAPVQDAVAAALPKAVAEAIAAALPKAVAEAIAAALPKAMAAAETKKRAREKALISQAQDATFVVLEAAGAGDAPCCVGAFVSNEVAITVSQDSEPWLGAENTVKGRRWDRNCEGSVEDLTFTAVSVLKADAGCLFVLKLTSSAPRAAALRRSFLPLPSAPISDYDLMGEKVLLLRWSLPYSCSPGDSSPARPDIDTNCQITCVSRYGFTYYTSLPFRGDFGCAAIFVSPEDGTLLGMGMVEASLESAVAFSRAASVWALRFDRQEVLSAVRDASLPLASASSSSSSASSAACGPA